MNDFVYTEEDMLRFLPAVISDLKHHTESKFKLPTNQNIQKDLYRRVILCLHSNDKFGYKEKMPDGREGIYIKGFVRDVWEYLETAYDLIHSTDFENQYALLIKDNL